MRFQEEGNVQVVIRKAILADPKFAQPPAFDVCIEVEDEAGHKDWWRGEMSANYGKGNAASKTQAEMTMATLAKVGLPDGDLSKLETLVGKLTEAWIKASPDGKFFNVRGLGESTSDVTPLAPADAAARIAALFGTPAPAAASPQAAPTGRNPFAKSAAPGNPFAKK